MPPVFFMVRFRKIGRLTIFYLLLLGVIELMLNFGHTATINKPSVSKSELPLTTASQFSGALHWAHEQGIDGTGVSAIVMEPDPLTPVSFSSLPPNVVVSDDMYQPSSRSHAQKVTEVLLEISPKSNITLISSDFNLDIPFYKDLLKRRPEINPGVKESIVVNLSFGLSRKQGRVVDDRTFQGIDSIEKKNFFIYSKT